jgi:hypothetical protein
VSREGMTRSVWSVWRVLSARAHARDEERVESKS